jgi:hypothetical protein
VFTTTKAKFAENLVATCSKSSGCTTGAYAIAFIFGKIIRCYRFFSQLTWPFGSNRSKSFNNIYDLPALDHSLKVLFVSKHTSTREMTRWHDAKVRKYRLKVVSNISSEPEYRDKKSARLSIST